MVIYGGFSDLLVRSSRRRAVVVQDLRAHKGRRVIVCNRFQSQRQRGTYAVEFALVFPLFFLIVYATLTYGLIFTAQQSLNYAAETGARAALSWPESDGRAAAALKRAEEASNWIDSLSRASTGGENLAIAVCGGDGSLLDSNGAAGADGSLCTSGLGASQLGVVLHYPYTAAPLIPMLGGSLMGFAVPDTLTAIAQVNLKIAYGASDGR